MRTDETICLNSKVDGKQPSLENRIYFWGGCGTAITTCFLPLVLTYEESEDSSDREDMEKRK